MCSLCAGAGRCSIPCTPCIGSFAGAGRCSIPCTPCIGSVDAGADRCSILTFLTCASYALVLAGAQSLSLVPFLALVWLIHQYCLTNMRLHARRFQIARLYRRSAATVSIFAAFCAQVYHSCSCPEHLSAPCAVASSLHHYSLALLVSASIRPLGSVHSPRSIPPSGITDQGLQLEISVQLQATILCENFVALLCENVESQWNDMLHACAHIQKHNGAYTAIQHKITRSHAHVPLIFFPCKLWEHSFISKIRQFREVILACYNVLWQHYAEQVQGMQGIKNVSSLDAGCIFYSGGTNSVCSACWMRTPKEAPWCRVSLS